MGWYYTSRKDRAMTLVLATHNKTSITVVSDGLSRMFDPDTRVEDTPLTDTRKVIPLGKYLVMGYCNTGIAYEYMQGMLFYVKECLIYDNCATVELASDVVKVLTQKYMATNPLASHASFRILLAGFDKDSGGQPINPNLWVNDHLGQQGKSSVNYTAIGADHIGTPIFKKLSGNKPLSMKKALENGRETLYRTAKLNDYVGGKFTGIHITKKGVSERIDLGVYTHH